MRTARFSRRGRPSRSRIYGAGGGGGGGSFPSLATGDIMKDETNSSALIFTAPATVNAGDLMVLVGFTIGATAALDITGTNDYDEGWTRHVEQIMYSNAAWRFGVWTKTALGTEASTSLVCVMNNGGSFQVGGMMRFDGAGTLAQVALVEGVNLTTGEGVTEITPSADASLIGYCMQYNGGTWTPSANDIYNSGSGNHSVAVTDQGEVPSGVPVDTDTFVHGTARVQNGVLALEIGPAA